jgi:hypothetical protein
MTKPLADRFGRALEDQGLREPDNGAPPSIHSRHDLRD